MRELLPSEEWGPAGLSLAAAAFLLGCVGVSLVPAAFYVRWLLGAPWSPWRAVLFPGAWLLWGLALSAISIAARWTLLPRIREGVFPLYSGLAIRWGIIHRLTHLTQSLFVGHFAGTPWVNLWFRALGADIAGGVVLNSTDLTDWDLLRIGRGTLVGFRAAVQAHSGERGVLRFRAVTVGADVLLARGSMVFDGALLGDGVTLAPGSLVAPGKRVEGASTFCGIPARRVTSSVR